MTDDLSPLAGHTAHQLRELLRVTEAAEAAQAEREKEEAEQDRERYAQLETDGRIAPHGLGWHRANRPRPVRPQPPARDAPVSLNELPELTRGMLMFDLGPEGTAVALYTLACRAGMNDESARRFARDVVA